MNIAFFPVPVIDAGTKGPCDGNHHRTEGLPMSGIDVSHVWDKDKFMQFIRSRFQQSADYHLASLTGISAATCRKHIYGETKPSADHVLQYLAVFGPPLLVAVMGEAAPEWVGRVQHEERKRDLEIEAKAIAAQLAEYQVG